MIDGGCFWGRNPLNGNTLGGELPGVLGGHAVEVAVVSHYKCLFYDHEEGNRELLALAKRHPGRIIPAVGLSPQGLDSGAVTDYLSGLRDSGARVLCLFEYPRYYDPDLDGMALGKAVEEAARLGYVIQVGLESLEGLRLAVRNFGALPAPVLLRWTAGGCYFALAELLHALEARGNLFLDVGSLTTMGGIEMLVRRLGADRLYVASNAPEALPGAALAMVEAAGISRAEKDAILGGTLAGLFGLDARRSGEDSTAPRGLLDEGWIDTHCHIGSHNLVEPLDDRAMVDELKRRGCAAFVVSSAKALTYDVEEGNADVLRLVEGEEKAFGLIVLDPLRLDVSFREIERYAGHPKFVGLKTVQDYYGLGLADERYLEIFKRARRTGLPVLAHIPGLADAARACPWMTFVCAHSTWGRVKSMVDIPNIYFDLATSHRDADESRLDLLVERAGANRVLFASDTPLIEPAWTLGKLAQYGFDAATLRAVLRDNAGRAFPKLKTAAGADGRSERSCQG